MSKVLDGAYSGMATFGRVMTDFSAVVGTLVAILFLGIGIYLLYVKKVESQDPNDPNSKPKTVSSRPMGFVFIAIAIVVLVASWGMVYTTHKSKVAAAMVGGVDAADMIRKAL